MKTTDFDRMEAYMRSVLSDSAHDTEHVYRVLYLALDIAEAEPSADTDVLIAACLLHDIGRPEQNADPSLDHAQVGAEKAYAFLQALDFPEDFAGRVRACIRSHRFRVACPPESLEAKILFDADKLDVCGASGIARTLLYTGRIGAPLFRRGADGTVSDGSGGFAPGTDEAEVSFLEEYHFKLEKLYDRFFTSRGAALARERQAAAAAFYENLLAELRTPEETGDARLRRLLEAPV